MAGPTDPRSRRSAARSPSGPHRPHCACGPRPGGLRRARALDQALRVRQHDRVVPGALHHERQFERRCGSGRARAATDNRLAVPLRSRSRAGIDAEPVNARPTLGPSMRTSSTFAMPCVILRLTVSFSKGVLPVRNSPPPESGRRSRRLSNCSTLKPAIAPLRLVRLAVPLSLWSGRRRCCRSCRSRSRDCLCPRAGECRTSRRDIARDRRW